METTITRLYQVKANQNVNLKISIGFRQLGVTNVYLEGDKIVDGKQGKVEKDLGEGSALRGKMLRCSTMVQDVRGETNKTSVGYELTGGNRPYDEKSQKVVSKNGEVVWYSALFIFL